MHRKVLIVHDYYEGTAYEHKFTVEMEIHALHSAHVRSANRPHVNLSTAVEKNAAKCLVFIGCNGEHNTLIVQRRCRAVRLCFLNKNVGFYSGLTATDCRDRSRFSHEFHVQFIASDESAFLLIGFGQFASATEKRKFNYFL